MDLHSHHHPSRPSFYNVPYLPMLSQPTSEVSPHTSDDHNDNVSTTSSISVDPNGQMFPSSVLNTKGSLFMMHSSHCIKLSFSDKYSRATKPQLDSTASSDIATTSVNIIKNLNSVRPYMLTCLCVFITLNTSNLNPYPLSLIERDVLRCLFKINSHRT